MRLVATVVDSAGAMSMIASRREQCCLKMKNISVAGFGKSPVLLRNNNITQNSTNYTLLVYQLSESLSFIVRQRYFNSKMFFCLFFDLFLFFIFVGFSH